MQVITTEDLLKNLKKQKYNYEKKLADLPTSKDLTDKLGKASLSKHPTVQAKAMSDVMEQMKEEAELTGAIKAVSAIISGVEASISGVKPSTAQSKPSKKAPDLPHSHICDACAQRLGGKWPKGHGHVTTFHNAICKYCGVLNERLAWILDYDWPHIDLSSRRD